jgi:Cu(I)/Ag(I) efflux system protein CusF
MRESGQNRFKISSMLVIAIALSISSCQRSNPPVTSPAKPADNPQAGAKGPPGFPPAVMNKAYPATGVVVQINRQEGWIEINHDEIKELMPAMQMEFWVRDKALLDQVKAGDHVDFTVLETSAGEYLTELKRSAAAQPR